MITLSTSIPILAGLNGVTVGYNKIRVTSIQFDLTAQGITAIFQLVVSTDLTKPAIIGTIVLATTGTPGGTISIPSLSISTSFPIPGLVVGIQTIMANFQNQLENALISQGIVAGTQAAGQ